MHPVILPDGSTFMQADINMKTQKEEILRDGQKYSTEVDQHLHVGGVTKKLVKRKYHHNCSKSRHRSISTMKGA